MQLYFTVGLYYAEVFTLCMLCTVETQMVQSRVWFESSYLKLLLLNLLSN